jgi:nucleoside-diphosphate-sugar epimerase
VAEQIHRTWQARALGRRLTILRPGIVFGQGEGGNYTRLAKALRKGFFAYAGRRDTLKAGIYVKDLVRVMDLMSQAQNCPFQLYNCCFPKAPTIEKIVETMMQVMGVRRFVPRIPARILKAGAKALGVLDSVGIGFHPERVTKLMISTNISGEKLQRDYPLQFDLKTALEDWWKDCGGKGLE